ncbi:hypothetical protein DM01DRAFT_251318 [Hesseltinella vesiculosa]|uniref:Protein CASP n=1 Tax=Hesseltinella vesiculosa TaxID=101127 RepID=A0A1X2GL05_9FUNG|nr:hypothetical protein DM01DRAFT_251318 [Hesseltinella vesiculosa]
MTTESSYSVAIQQWKNVNLNAVQRDLDEQGLAIVENQKDGIVSRKRLAEHTREFKKLSDEDKLQQFKSLLKGYQSEIDNVTRRTKYAENAFLTIYKLLADVPDPLPLFEAAVEQSAKAVDHQQLETRVKDLQDQLAKHEQVHQINDQLVQENAQLKQKVSQLETRMEDKKAEDLVKKEQELKSQYNAKIIHYKEKEHDLQLQLNQALTHLNQLQVTHDNTQAQLIDHNQQYHQDVVGKLAELDVVMMDMERANARIIELENRNKTMAKQCNLIRHCRMTWLIFFSLSCLHSDARVQDTQHETDLNRLIKDVDTYKNLLQKTETRNSKKIKELAAETKSLMDQNTSLQAKIKEFDDYHEIKRELNIMKYVEFSNGDEDEDEFDAKEVLAASAHGSLEVQLMDKNKKLENNYTQLRVQFKQLQQSFDENQNKLEALDSKCTEQQDLVQRLEEDLLRGVGPKAPIRQLPSRTSSPNPNAMITGQASVTAASSTGTAPLPVGNTTDDQSILPIVMQQRDRFRQRNNELEQKARSLEQKLYDVQGEMDHLRQDNVKLYERLKFVHNRSTMIPMADLDGPSNRRTGEMDRYDKIYEENMNPFAQFHRKEEKRRLNAMSLADKLTLKMTRVMFSQKWTRYFMIGYALLLHLLVVTTLYQLSLWECRHDHEAFNLPQK